MAATMVLGTALKPNIDWMRQDCGEDGWTRVLDQLGPEDRKSIELLNGAMKYPASLFDALNRAYAGIRYPGDTRGAGEAFKRMGRHTAEEHLSGIYSVFLRLASPEGTLTRVPSLLGRLYEGVGGEAEVLSAPGGPRGIMRVTGLGDVAFTGPRLIGWAEGALAKTGAKNARVVERSWEAGRLSADPLVFELYWD